MLNHKGEPLGSPLWLFRSESGYFFLPLFFCFFSDFPPLFEDLADFASIAFLSAFFFAMVNPFTIHRLIQI